MVVVRNGHGEFVRTMTGNIKEIFQEAIKERPKVASIKENGVQFITRGHLYFRYGVEQKVIVSEGVVEEDAKEGIAQENEEEGVAVEEHSFQDPDYQASYSGQSGYQQGKAGRRVTLTPGHLDMWTPEEEDEDFYN